MTNRLTILVFWFVLGGCAHSKETAPAARAPNHDPSQAAPSKTQVDADRPELVAVAQIHGGAGPWAVAGYRMGRFALERLGLARGSFDLEIVHYTPKEVQYSCIADGAAAATGASLGKLNLSLAEVPPESTKTVYRRRSTGDTVTLRLTESFRARFLDVPREQRAEAGRQVLGLRDREIFEVVP